ncbi:MAG: TIGR03619 family F420-dependent LLM class oxidoreductase [Candidatus Binatia bacterium]
MKFWQSLAFVELEQIIEVARCAEDLGFYGVNFGDHLVTTKEQADAYFYTKDGRVLWEPHTHWPDPWVLIAALARETTRLRFLTTVYVLPLRDPFSAAKAISTAAVLSDNRVMLGIGVGWQKAEFELTGQAFRERGRRCNEQIAVMRRLFSGEMVEFHGEFFDFGPLMMSPGTSRPVPVLVGGDSPAALRRAAQNDGWLGLRYTEEQIPSILARLQAARRAEGRLDTPFEVWLVPLMSGPGMYTRLEEMGVTMVNGANFFVDGKVVPTTLDFKKRRMEQFASRAFK